MNTTLLKDGMIPPNTVCPFASICGIKKANECEQEIAAPTDCSLARGYDIEQQNEKCS